jgi:hypothetical protein
MNMRIDRDRRRQVCGWLLVVALVLLPGVVYAQEGALVVSRGEQVVGDVATIQRHIRIEGMVQGDVTSWFGSIYIQGTVAGDVVSYGGSITLDDGARVDGSVLGMGGEVQQHHSARVAGQLIGDAFIGKQMTASLLNVADGQHSTPTAWLHYVLVSVALCGLVLALAALSMLIWPHRITRTSEVLLAMPWRSLLLGLLTTLLLGTLLLFGALLLALSLVGLPLLLVLVLLAHLPYVYGLVSLALALVRRVTEAQQRRVALWAVVLATLVLFVPVVLVAAISTLLSAALFYLLASAGLGAAVLSRGGVLVPAVPAMGR